MTSNYDMVHRSNFFCRLANDELPSQIRRTRLLTTQIALQAGYTPVARGPWSLARRGPSVLEAGIESA